MKLKDNCYIQIVDDARYLAFDGEDAAAAEINDAAAVIVELLGEETTEESVTDALCRRFDAPREEIAADVREILSGLRSIGALEE